MCTSFSWTCICFYKALQWLSQPTAWGFFNKPLAVECYRHGKFMKATHPKGPVEKPAICQNTSFRGSEATVGISCYRKRSFAALRMTIFNYWLFQQAPKELGHPPFSDGIPVIEKTKAETEVLVRDGITLIIGGLMKNETRKNIRKIPLLGDIPLLGKLFSSTDNQRVKSEIIIFITPHIITGEATQERGKWFRAPFFS